MARSHLALLLLCSCVLPHVPEAPTYAEDCTPSHDEFAQLARDPRLRPDLGEGPIEPEAALALVYSELERIDYELRLVKGYRDAVGFTCLSALGVVVCDASLAERDAADQADTLAHELTHGIQARALGHKKFLTVWGDVEGRRALENAARSVQYNLETRMGIEPDVERWRAVAEADGIRYGWVNGPAPAHCAIEAAVQLWLEDQP